MHSVSAPQIAPRLILPDPPATESSVVKAWRQPVSMQTYLPEAPDRNPMFLEKRVYQGSSGRVYPIPFIDRIATSAQERDWDAVHIENEFIRLMILPEIGGRIHVGLDKTNGYDFFYRQNIIKPALVGLAGPWISGGVEFNWPQHHRPATFMPVEIELERSSDGSVTIWCSDHDPLTRMKGMHGVCLHPGKAYVELKVRLFNRTPYVQTFLWWANVATRVHEKYQSFFPPDVRFVADHARRAITSFPLSDRPYYGVDYAKRAEQGVPEQERPLHFIPDGSYPPNDLSWYANIPVPTSYMIMGTRQDFFGGYDHAAGAGVVHVASHHIAPGKKQWTWGNHNFGYAWDRCLTDSDGPYIELMAGVYTDNQPDFSFLAPWETRTFRQIWYPIRQIGPPQAANLDAALRVDVDATEVRIGVCVTNAQANAKIVVTADEALLAEWTRNLEVNDSMQVSAALPEGVEKPQIAVRVEAGGRELIRYEPERNGAADELLPATEPELPENVATNEELYLTGLHIEQYRHATRAPEAYWREALRRDPGDSRCNNALGMWHLRRGEFADAEWHFRAAIARLTQRNANPRDGEPFYNLGLALRFRGRHDDAYTAFYKATWNESWQAPAFLALAECDACRAKWEQALTHVTQSLTAAAQNLNARNLQATLLRKLGRQAEAMDVLRETQALDPLDHWARHMLDGKIPANNQQLLDLAFDFSRAGLLREAVDLLLAADLTRGDGAAPMILYTLAHLHAQLGEAASSAQTYARAAASAPEYCFPSRLEEMLVLEEAMCVKPEDARAHYYLGNLLYDRRRHEEAIAQWERSTQLEAGFSTGWRNLGIAYFNVRGDSVRAREAFNRAFAANSEDARILYERDQLWKRTGESPGVRLAELERHPQLSNLRDDLSIEVATLLNQAGEPARALALLLGRIFQPWEGGEGLVLAQYMRANLLLGQRALDACSAEQARKYFQAALAPPESLGEAKHLLANQSDIHFWIGASYAEQDRAAAAEAAWRSAASQMGDFQQMSVRSVSDMTFWGALASRSLGHADEATRLFESMLEHSMELERQPARIDYFATSLPAMLLFDDDLNARKLVEAAFLRGQAFFGLGRRVEGDAALRKAIELDRNHFGATNLLECMPLLDKLTRNL
jgi:Flp pilus assembly protein TadD